MMVAPDIVQLADRFDTSAVRAVALMGSYARGDAGPYSDVDLVRFLAEDAGVSPGSGSHLIDGRLVVVSDTRPTDVEEWFARPELAVSRIPGLRHALPLIDRNGSLAILRSRARAFAWDEAMQTRADAWAGEQMVGWIEEVHKGLEGLRRDDVGRLLNARFGLSWGLSRVVQVQRGVFLSGDNAFFEAVETAIGPNTEWARLRRAVFGVAGLEGHPPSLREQVAAGLRLYIATADLIEAALRPAAAPLVKQTVALIESVLGPGAEHAPERS